MSLTLEARPVVESGEVSSLADDEAERALAMFMTQRNSLFHIAFQITRDASRAEDCVQEAWLRWQLTDRSNIINPSAFLTTTVSHLAINLIQSAAHRHELASDSLADDPADHTYDPAHRAEQSASVSEVLALLMARLSHAQLTAYLLRKGFDYPYADIARLLRTSIPNARQLIRRAQARVDAGRDRPVKRNAHRLLVAAFLIAERLGDFTTLERLLTHAEPTGRPHGSALDDAAP